MKGYKVHNLHTRKISISRDVIFHESIFPFSPSSKSLLSKSPPLSIPLPACNLDFDVSSSPGFVSAGTPLSTLSSPSSILVGSLPIPLPADQHDAILDQSPSISIDQLIDQPIVLPDQSNSIFIVHHAVLLDLSPSLPPDQPVFLKKIY